MTDRELRDLLTDAVADVEPRYALDEIRSRTTPTRRRWPYAAGGAVLAVAASVAAFALIGNDAPPRASDPASSTSPSTSTSPSPTTSPSASPSASPSTSSSTEIPTAAGAVYYVGDTPDGQRLYREFRRVSEIDPLVGALDAAVQQQPTDPDYRSIWPRTGAELRSAEVRDGVIRIELDESATGTHGLPETERQMAIEQLIYTAQAAVQERLPVQFLVNDNPSAEILGLPASEPLANGPVLETLALVSITSPGEGIWVDNDEPLVVEGVGNSFEGNIVTWVEDLNGSVVVGQEPTIAGWLEEKLFPYDVRLDLSELPPGEYVVISSTDDPSGRGRFHIDSRSITVVD